MSQLESKVNSHRYNGPAKVAGYFIMPDGTTKAENELTREEFKGFCQRAAYQFPPLMYGALMKDTRQKVKDPEESSSFA